MGQTYIYIHTHKIQGLGFRALRVYVPNYLSIRDLDNVMMVRTGFEQVYEYHVPGPSTL